MGDYYKREESFANNEAIDRFIEFITKNKKDLLKILNKYERGYDYRVSSMSIITFSRRNEDIGTVTIRRSSRNNKWISVLSHSFNGDTSEISIFYSKLKKSFNISEGFGGNSNSKHG